MISTLDLVLTGARAGKTIKLNGKQFVNGTLRLRGSHEQLEPVISYYGRAYAAFPFGSEALKQAQTRDREAAKAAAMKNGEHNAHTDAEPGQAVLVQRSGADGPTGGDKAPAPADQHGGGDGSQAGGEGLRSDRDGHSDAGLRAGQGSKQQQSDANGDLTRIREAVLGLDPDVAENWTQDGRPTVDAVAVAVNDAAITRKMIDAAAADWNRDQAVAKAKLAKG